MVRTYLHRVVWNGIGGDEHLRRIDTSCRAPRRMA